MDQEQAAVKDTEQQEDTRLKWTPHLIRFLRMSKDWSLHDFCCEFMRVHPEPESKVSKNQILEYELGNSIPRADRLAMIADVFKVEPDFFFTRSHEEVDTKMNGRYKEILESVKRRGPTKFLSKAAR